MTISLEGTTAILGVIVSACAMTISLYVIRSERRQKKLDNLIAVQEFLHRDDLSEARRRVRSSTTKLSLSSKEVRKVCSSFDFAAALVRCGAINEQVFIDYWRFPLMALVKNLSPIGDDAVGVGVTVREYYKDFWWLMEFAESSASAMDYALSNRPAR